MKNAVIALLVLVALAIIAGVVAILLSREQATIAVEDGYGSNPKLPLPNPKLLPTVDIAPASPCWNPESGELWVAVDERDEIVSWNRQPRSG